MNPMNRTPNATLSALEARLSACSTSSDYVATIHALAATRDPRAVAILARLLDSTGPIAEAAIAALLSFGEAAVPAMRRCADSLDADMIRHAHEVLSRLGDAASAAWLARDNSERAEAYLESMGLLRELAEDDVLAARDAANDATARATPTTTTTPTATKRAAE